MGKVFLGGTTYDNPQDDWRDSVEVILKDMGIDYFNPIVDDWTPECIEIEKQEKLKCDTHLYIITKEMRGVYSIAEAVYSSFYNDKATVFLVVEEGFEDGQLRSLRATGELIESNQGLVQFFDSKDKIGYYVKSIVEYIYWIGIGEEESEVKSE